MLNYGLNLTLKLILFSLIHLLGLRVWCLSLGFVQLTDHDVVTCNHNNLSSSSVKVTSYLHTKFKGEIAISCLSHLSHQGLPEGHSDLLNITFLNSTQI